MISDALKKKSYCPEILLSVSCGFFICKSKHKTWSLFKHNRLCIRLYSGGTHSLAVTTEGNQSRHGHASGPAQCRIQGLIWQPGIKRMSDKSVAKRFAGIIFSQCM